MGRMKRAIGTAMGHGFRRVPYVEVPQDAVAGGGPASKRCRLGDNTYQDSGASDADDSDDQSGSSAGESTDDSDDKPLVGAGNAGGPEGSPGAVLYALMGAPTGEIAYGTRLTLDVLPEMHIKKFGKLEFPITPDQAFGLRAAAKKLRTKDWGAGWANCQPKTPTWTILDKYMEIRNEEWENYLFELSDRATEFLGFRNERRKMSVELHGLFLWENKSLFRSYTRKIDDPTRVGTLLIILNDDYTGGDIAIGCGNRDTLFQPERADTTSYMIVSHAHSTYDVLPIDDGFRIALSYDLCLPKQNNQEADTSILRKLLQATNRAEVETYDAITAWALRIHRGTLDNFPIIFVFQDADQYDPTSQRLDMDMLTPRDRAKAALARMLKVRRIRVRGPGNSGGGFKLHVYLAVVTATTKNYGWNEARRVKYAVERATSLAGVPKPEVARETILDEKGVLQGEEFARMGEVKKQVSRKMTTTVRTRVVGVLSLRLLCILFLSGPCHPFFSFSPSCFLLLPSRLPILFPSFGFPFTPLVSLSAVPFPHSPPVSPVVFFFSRFISLQILAPTNHRPNIPPAEQPANQSTFVTVPHAHPRALDPDQ